MRYANGRRGIELLVSAGSYGRTNQQSLVFSPAGRKLATSNSRGRIGLTSEGDAKDLLVCTGSSDPAGAFAFAAGSDRARKYADGMDG